MGGKSLSIWDREVGLEVAALYPFPFVFEPLIGFEAERLKSRIEAKIDNV
jgi:hypothetical protein